MTNPETGVWLSEDGTIGKPDPSNPYRYAGNNPTNATDPSGLSYRYLIGSVKGPEDATDPNQTDARIEYRQVRGSGFWANLWHFSLYWGQPGDTAWGDAKMLTSYTDRSQDRDGTVITPKYGGAMSTITVEGRGGSGGHCNTVPADQLNQDYLNNQSSDAGEISADLVNFKPGLYTVEVRLKVNLFQWPNSVIGASAKALVDAGNGATNKPAFADDVSTHREPIGDRRIAIKDLPVQVLVGPSGRGRVAIIDPTVVGPIGGFGRAQAELSMFIFDIKPVK